MTKLKVLVVSRKKCFCSLIGQTEIDNLNLIRLYASNNTNIVNVAFMKNLQVLHISGTCAIGQESLDVLNLVELCISDNISVVNLSHMTNLKTLFANGKSALNNDKIKNLQLYELSINNNVNITDVSSIKTKDYMQQEVQH
ncbi:MAG: hypothetical protein EOP34_09455 [Rickettsiales bacterium]|nr:MAG: hypothetical protein EOP34_09455 [Rickettsiales bacterium]